VSKTPTGIRSVDEMDEAEVRTHLAELVAYLIEFDVFPMDDANKCQDEDGKKVARAAHWALWVHRNWEHVKQYRADPSTSAERPA
jgi:hypothetical protein